jgi:hypothetical protein
MSRSNHRGLTLEIPTVKRASRSPKGSSVMVSFVLLCCNTACIPDRVTVDRNKPCFIAFQLSADSEETHVSA